MKKTAVTEELIEKFKSRAETLNFAGLIKNNPDAALYTDNDGCMLVSPDLFGEGTTCCVYSYSERFADEACAKLSGEITFCGISDFVRSRILQKHAPLWETRCGLYVWNGKPLTYRCQADLRPMNAAFAEEVSLGTPYRASFDDIKECIANRPSCAVYVDEKPVCWCLTHFENSLGMLYTLPEHRRKGYALEVMTCITNKLIAQGDIPYAYIVKGNSASELLAPKYNLQYVCDVTWLGVFLPERC